MTENTPPPAGGEPDDKIDEAILALARAFGRQWAREEYQRAIETGSDKGPVSGPDKRYKN